MKNITYLYAALGLIVLTMASCEDTIEVDSGFEESQIVIDAWITDLPQDQTIIITQTQDYFDSRVPTPVTDAIVRVENGGETFEFDHTTDGNYVWPYDGRLIAEVGDVSTLTIEANGKTYTSTAVKNRVPEIDSISITFEESNGPFEEGIYGQAFARDFAGTGDAYWMRSYYNDTLLNKPSELNLIWDATFDPGSGLDGVYFIPPIRLGIMPTDDDGGTILYQPGDEVRVELWSISPLAFNFMSIAVEQATNGDNGIFALPLANTRGNIEAVGSEETVIGMFNVAAVSVAEETVE
jgi:hypothetical protein